MTQQVEVQQKETAPALELYRNNRRKWYVLLEGPLKELVMNLTQQESNLNVSAATLATKYDARSFFRDSNGIVRGLVFGDKTHAQFKHKNKFGYSLPKPGSQAEGDIAALPATEQASIALLGHLGPINSFEFEFSDVETASVTRKRAIMVPGDGIPAFDYTVGKGIICLYLPDRQAAAQDLTKRFSNVSIVAFEQPAMEQFGLLNVPYLTYKAFLEYNWSVPMFYRYTLTDNTVEITSVEYNKMKAFPLETDPEAIKELALSWIRELCLTVGVNTQFDAIEVDENTHPVLVWN